MSFCNGGGERELCNMKTITNLFVIPTKTHPLLSFIIEFQPRKTTIFFCSLVNVLLDIREVRGHIIAGVGSATLNWGPKIVNSRPLKVNYEWELPRPPHPTIPNLHCRISLVGGFTPIRPRQDYPRHFQFQCHGNCCTHNRIKLPELTFVFYRVLLPHSRAVWKFTSNLGLCECPRVTISFSARKNPYLGPF